ncbi:LD-carboxypeptidase [Streptomyces sp. NPDC021098]|uniref:LD-carboxypeptidase n=1 Tax=Streptomyces sp. NPDC021098 TaxID=3365113 RepID=UPI00379A249E
MLTSWGLRVELGEHVFDQWGYMAGRDEDRVFDLNSAFGDPGVRAVIATRGGKGAYRIVDDLDTDTLRRDPKPLVGFSDITHLHLALWARCGLASLHGPVRQLERRTVRAGVGRRPSPRTHDHRLRNPPPGHQPSNRGGNRRGHRDRSPGRRQP